MNDKQSNDTPGGIAGVIRQGISNAMKDVHTALPGEIVEFDPANQTAKVQLLIKRIFKGDKNEDLPQLINVPVWQPRAGGFTITFPIAAGDECLVLFSERSLDNWFKFGGSQAPKDKRMHSLSDAVCLVGMSSEPTVITNYDADNLQIRNEDNDQHVTLYANKDIDLITGDVIINMDNGADTITMTAPTKVIVDTPDAQFTGDVQINGSLNVTGTSTASDHISSGISGKTHIHGGVVPGGGISGVPQ